MALRYVSGQYSRTDEESNRLQKLEKAGCVKNSYYVLL